MSDKARIFKARFSIADLRQQRNHQEVFTTALTKNETLEHFVLKLLGYCLLSYDSHAVLNKFSDRLQPDVGIKALDEHYKTWLSVDQPNLDQLLKIAKQVDELLILTMGNSEWLAQSESRLKLFSNSHIIEIDQQFVDDIQTDLTRSLNWNVTIDESSLMITDKVHCYETKQFDWH
ncbi:YaeQ family protein [Pseudoalteromonas ostreae]|uniref:YaeQ family protein n=1 Tax=Pseudoalteromonas ostreae TaxID=2774154 RepID=UPI001B3775D8|nr:YaeQ family protein [Pseudoalteromonas ostreae]